MSKTTKYGSLFLLSILLTFVILGFMESTAKATTLPTDYNFYFGNVKVQNEGEYEMKASNLYLRVSSASSWESGTTVEWLSSDNNVVTIEKTTTASNIVKLVRKGPGYTNITAIIKQGSSTYTVSCLVKVNLEIDHQNTGTVSAKTTKDKILVIDTIGSTKQAFLKYVDYYPDGSVVEVSGSAIDGASVLWESDNEGVVTVDPVGKIKAIGSGSAMVTATTTTLSASDKALSVSLMVVVSPTFGLEYVDASNVTHKPKSVNDPAAVNAVTEKGVANKVPSSFVIESNANIASNLTWVVYDSKGKKITAGTSEKMTYTVSTISGNVSFSGVKAGTYEIYAFANKDYNEETKAPFAYMKIIVPIDLGDISVVMNVGDTYSIEENSNIPNVKMFGYSYFSGNANIASIDTGTSIITARKKGTVIFQLDYDDDFELFDAPIGPMYITVTVIDGISLSMTNATMYTKGTLYLDAIVTDPTIALTWSSSDTSIATVKDGLVTGVKAGIATITVKQKVNGVIKKATCTITVQQSVSKIVIDPVKATLAIGSYTTLHATVTPTNLTGVKLQWKSSDESIVTVEEASALTATIKGQAGGTAVISAINQDNVVVGYCHVTVNQPVTSIVLSETDVSVSLSSKTLQIRATAYPDNAVNKAIKWSSSDTAKATVNENGLVTFKKAGTVTIIATSVDNTAVTAICNITIQTPVVSVALDERTKTMYVGQTARLTYSVLPSNASTSSVTWTSTNTSVATVDSTGLVTAKGVGSTVIILKTIDGGYSVYCTIIVKRVATTVKFDVTELSLKVGGFYYIKTTLTPADSTDKELVWESSDTKIAVVDNDGKVTAKAAGSAIIMARTEAGGIAYCKVTVSQPVGGLILNFSEKTIYVNEKFELSVSVSPSSATNLGVTWKSSNTKIATITKEGIVQGLVGGVAIITCTTADGGYTATCVVTVRESISTIKLNYENYSIGLKKTVKLTATVSTETATNQKVMWSSSNDKVATVNQKGKVTGVSVGYAIITATALDGSDVEATCEIRVVTPVTSLVVNKPYLAMLVGDTRTVKATIRPTNATYKKAKWSSSDEKVALVDDDGVVTALKAGTAIITAEANDSSGKKAMTYVTVRDRLPSTGVTLMDKKVVMVPGESKIVEVVLNPAASTDSYTWSSDNAAVARVDKKTGKIIARSTGSANITVMTDSGKTATVEVTVIGLNITSLVIEEYTTYAYPLEVEGATGTVRWSIDNPLVAVINNGVISTRGVGTATITAIVNGRKLTCKLKVVKMK